MRGRRLSLAAIVVSLMVLAFSTSPAFGGSEGGTGGFRTLSGWAASAFAVPGDTELVRTINLDSLVTRFEEVPAI